LLDVRIPADVKAIGNVTDTISRILVQLGTDEEKRHAISLAVHEALANAVVHGCNSDPSKQVRCRLRRDFQGAMVITVTDSGPGFSLAAVADPKHPDRLYAGNGRGIYLIRQLMDEVHFENGGNQITMRKY